MPTYFMMREDGKGPIKIGHSENPEQRAKGLSTASPSRFKVLNTTDVEEGTIHQYFSHLRLHGEFFDPAQELLDFIANPFDPTNHLETHRSRSENSQYAFWLFRYILELDDDLRAMLAEYARKLFSLQRQRDKIDRKID